MSNIPKMGQLPTPESRFQWLLQQRPGCMANAFLHPRGNAEGHGKLDQLESVGFLASCWMDRLVGYPLVNIQKTMENHHFYWENPL